MKIEERHLVQIAAVVQCGGATEAAVMLGTTQPAISRTISQLEARLGDALFEKGRRPLKATALGAVLALHGRDILAASRRASAAVGTYQNGTSGLVRIGGVPYFMDAVVTGAVAKFTRTRPDLRVDQIYGNMPELFSKLRDAALDLVIGPVGSLDIGPDLHFEELIPARNVIACGAGHPLMGNARPKPTDLAGYPWVAPLPGSPLMIDLEMILFSLGIDELSIRYSGGSLMAVVTYLESTEALAILPQSVVDALSPRPIATLPFDIPQSPRTIGLISRAGIPLSPSIRKFSAHLVATLGRNRPPPPP